jgi:hypothetical protein
MHVDGRKHRPLGQELTWAEKPRNAIENRSVSAERLYGKGPVPPESLATLSCSTILDSRSGKAVPELVCVAIDQRL